MIGRADIEGSKSDVAKNAWPPQASYPCGNFSDTSGFKSWITKGSLGHSFKVCIITGNQNQESFYPYVQHEISVLIELPLGHLCCPLTDVPPQPNSPPDNVFNLDLGVRGQDPRKNQSVSIRLNLEKGVFGPVSIWLNKKNNYGDSGISMLNKFSHLCYILHVISQCLTRVKLNRVFFPRWFC
jgi:hypothetical protein